MRRGRAWELVMGVVLLFDEMLLQYLLRNKRTEVRCVRTKCRRGTRSLFFFLKNKLITSQAWKDRGVWFVHASAAASIESPDFALPLRAFVPSLDQSSFPLVFPQP